MILREFFYIDQNTLEPTEDKSYDPQYDHSVMKKSDTRKTRLTLRQINRTRLASDQHKQLKAKELDFVRQMYGLANQQAEGV